MVVSPNPDGNNGKNQKQNVTPGANMGSSSTGLGRKSPSIPQREVPDPIRESQESMESDDLLHTTLLIDTMEHEFEEKEKVVEVIGQHDSDLKVISEYRVESPEMSAEVIPAPPLVTEENLRFSLRNVQSNLERVEVKAAAAAKKRDLEDIPDTDFTSIDILRELEKARNKEYIEGKEDDNDKRNNVLMLTNGKGDQTPFDLRWCEENEVDEESFTRSREERNDFMLL
ncbi:uncharacterized protein LOC119353502 [Triticum dicoccoides]|uniref:uncharacterized protein LOC119353502 n=1 Tax=Triticum dicoccoides TaxID=85692 RepID=UPI0018906356|nr:uncharacterized protein LOC119353502 [Triticum dicoccoides]